MKIVVDDLVGQCIIPEDWPPRKIIAPICKFLKNHFYPDLANWTWSYKYQIWQLKEVLTTEDWFWGLDYNYNGNSTQKESLIKAKSCFFYAILCMGR